MKAFEEEFISFVQSLWQSFGLDPISSRLVGIIFLEPQEVSMEELAKRTGYSLASLSNKLRMLENMQVVKRIHKPGTKKAFYFIEKDVNSIIARKIQAMIDNYITPAKEQLPLIISRGKSGKLSAEDRRKMEIIQEYHRQLIQVDACLEKHRSLIERMRTDR